MIFEILGAAGLGWVLAKANKGKKKEASINDKLVLVEKALGREEAIRVAKYAIERNTKALYSLYATYKRNSYLKELELKIQNAEYEAWLIAAENRCCCNKC